MTENITSLPNPTGLDYLMARLESDIKFADKMYKENERLYTKHGKIPLFETPMNHHKTMYDDLSTAYKEIKRLHNIACCEGQDGNWTGDWRNK